MLSDLNLDLLSILLSDETDDADKEDIDWKSDDVVILPTPNANKPSFADSLVEIQVQINVGRCKDHYWNDKISDKYIIQAVYKQNSNETISNILNSVFGYIRNLSNVPNLRLKLESIKKNLFLGIESSFGYMYDDDDLQQAGNKLLTDYKKQDIINKGLNLWIKESTIELNTILYDEQLKEKKKFEIKQKQFEQEVKEGKHKGLLYSCYWSSYEMEDVSINVTTQDGSQFAFPGAQFIVHAMYSENEKISNIFKQVVDYMEKIHYPLKFKIDGQHMGGFVTENHGVLTSSFDEFVSAVGDLPMTHFKEFS